MTSITLISHPRSRGRIARWMLEEIGCEYDVERIDFEDSAQMTALRAINPMAKVPVLRHGDAIVTETAAICAYLADAFPNAGLAPPPDQRADYYRWLFFAAGPLEAATTNRALGVELKPEQQGFAGYGDIQRVLATLESTLSGGAWLAGERFSAADLYVGAQLNFGLQFGTIEQRAAFLDFVGLVTGRDAYVRATAIDDQLLAEAAE
jgi:glutathione S-transferase